MKKFMTILLSAAMLCSGFGGCTKNDGTSSGNDQKNDTSEIVTDAASLQYGFSGIYKNGELQDPENGFSAASDLKGARFCVNGKYQSEFTNMTSRQDVKMELYNADGVRMVNVSAGFAYTLPATEISADYTIAKYRTSVKFDDCVLTTSFEASNPYTSNPNPWYTYASEWLMCHLLDSSFYSKNNLTLLKGLDKAFTETSSTGDLETKEGFDLYRFDIKINDGDTEVEYPFYHIAVIRALKDNPTFNFALFVMKSKTNQADKMNDIVASYSKFTSKGIQKNYFDAGNVIEDPHWNAETLNYFRNISTSKTLNWGVFSWSMSGTGLTPGQGDYDSNLRNGLAMKNGIEQAMNKTYDIYPTYTHISYGNNNHYFPVAMATELAGGNGENGKPVLQFTYQFTTNNNIVADQWTPMFDILRGKYDQHFRKLAQDMKQYGKPILFRLNNEMNTDWTSYCGMMTLLDPDVFVMTWQRFYDICVDEGCDNVIWIWNPIATSCPYSSWGEDLCYFPGKNYVQLIGATDYEMNNYAVADRNNTENSIKSFAERYEKLYKKNCESGFKSWGVIISEFACGSGGDTSGVLGRNADTQAAWVKGMFDEFCKDEQPEYVKQLKGMVWFNCNDYVGTKISNRLRIFDPDSTAYDDLADTIKAFNEGFDRLEKKYGKR